MRYAAEVIELMAAYPGRKFRPGEVVRYVASRQAGAKVSAIRMGVQRVLLALNDAGVVERTLPMRPGSYALYSWRSRPVQTVTSSARIQ